MGTVPKFWDSPSLSWFQIWNIWTIFDAFPEVKIQKLGWEIYDFFPWHPPPVKNLWFWLDPQPPFWEMFPSFTLWLFTMASLTLTLFLYLNQCMLDLTCESEKFGTTINLFTCYTGCIEKMRLGVCSIALALIIPKTVFFWKLISIEYRNISVQHLKAEI